ncbi:hypothetical protein JZX87_13840 [Agrobacterium sp. Ap1]|uniref:hypothetical protein n=1 Tax=Agrobacterium sp. Ap1 TaxID=2815337 RepID=UPI001A8CD37C|nr:hypothetical protein [Agrobacterium sp. Ap1]MBO0142244.1 hypothetical protein [Agrobacterium sp. Ap1]
MAAIPGPFNIGFDFSAGGSRILSPTQGGGVVEPVLRPISYVKAIPNEYNGGAGLGASGKQVAGHCHFPIMADMSDGSHEVRFWHGGASAGQGEWNTGGTMKTSCSLIWTDTNGALQLTTYDNIKDTAQGFEETVHRAAIRPKVGSHAMLTYFAEFTNGGYYSHARADYAQGEALRYAASGLPNYVGTNSIYTDTYNGAGDFWGPSFFGWSGGDLSIPTAVIGIDSNHAGVLVGGVRSDIPDTLNGAIGSVARILLPFMPCIDISVPGGRAAEMADPSKTVYRDKIGGRKRGKVLIPVGGTNDVIFNSDSEATLDSNVSAYIGRQGFDLAFLPTIPPVVTSQASNNVYNAGRDTVRRARNTTLRGLSNVMDIAVGVESVGTPGTLQVLGDTIDGTHFNAQGNKRAAAGAGFNVPAKIPGASAVYVGYDLSAATAYRSKSFSGWSLSAGAARAAQDVYSPEHKLTAAVIRELAANNDHSIVLTSSITGLASTTKEYSVSIARGTGSRHAVIEIGKNGGNYAAMKYAINLATGATARTTGDDGTAQVHQSATATLDPDGFWRVIIRITYDATMPNNPFLFVRMASDAAGTTSYVGDDTSSLKLWGFDVK